MLDNLTSKPPRNREERPLKQYELDRLRKMRRIPHLTKFECIFLDQKPFLRSFLSCTFHPSTCEIGCGHAYISIKSKRNFFSPHFFAVLISFGDLIFLNLPFLVVDHNFRKIYGPCLLFRIFHYLGNVIGEFRRHILRNQEITSLNAQLCPRS